MSDFLTTFVEDLKTNVAGFIAVAVTEVKTGMSYKSLSIQPSFDPELASAYNLEVVKAKMTAIKALGLKEKIEDIMITLSNQIHIISVSANEEYFIYLAVDSSKANLGMTRAMLKKYSREIESKM
ncbi:hypothetical protein SY27_08485 [Flavobacterium sp. 316]|uniref:Regulator of Ras-like GTPase activity (Roadblock/LC7/MglB family) n=1 Tax=Flavobacterium sediminilitoris TaxID=2024526 RepID=A0ABY4HNP6_9FLAO|nr:MULTISPECIES: hypothetical protein [Flavobacterium]KIX21708.1 hypothetical protein SY27_08485 [Flavobacterium sp. 316]UOX34485.1 hypothetical protein LXD69_02995 [Flavobacterium sediminilitoris]